MQRWQDHTRIQQETTQPVTLFKRPTEDKQRINPIEIAAGINGEEHKIMSTARFLRGCLSVDETDRLAQHKNDVVDSIFRSRLFCLFVFFLFLPDQIFESLARRSFLPPHMSV